MGMPKIDKRSETFVVAILRSWPRQQRVTWEELRKKIAQVSRGKTPEWSRQALSKNEAIYLAYAEASSQQKAIAQPAQGRTLRWYAERLAIVTKELQQTKQRHELLQVRHTQLIYNASLLPGGTQLLSAPLPNNTRAQSG
jgi:hypothetical protein